MEPSKPTILEVTDAYFPNINGVSFAVDTLSTHLATDFNIKIVAPAFRLGSGREKQGGVEVERFISFPFPLYKGTHLANPNVRRFFRLVKETKPAVIHFHTVGPLGSLAILAAKRYGIPLVGTYHTVFPETLMYLNPTKRLKRYWELVEEFGGFHTPRVDFDFNLKPSQLPKEATWNIVNKYYSYADVVICPSLAIEKEVNKRNFTKPTVYISNGIDTSLFSPKKEGIFTRKLLFLGRLGYEKYVDVVIRAFAEIPVVSGVRLMIAGDGPAMGDLKRLTKKLGIADKVVFLGMVKKEERAKVYKDADMFVTAGMETQGLVVLEAFAAGLPVVATNKYALGDLIKPGVNGFLVAPGDYIGMAESIERILKDQKLFAKLQKGAVKTAKEHDIKNTVKETAELYKKLIETKVFQKKGRIGLLRRYSSRF